MRLDRLLADADLPSAGVAVLETRGDLTSADVAGMTLDSRLVGPGALYCCVPGQRHDGHEFAPEAVRGGAVALLCERALDLPVAQVVVAAPGVRPAIGPLAAALNGQPSLAMTVAGITGTNGKTTTAHLLASIFEAAGRRSATLGTLTGARTTPEAPELQETLARFRDTGIEAVAMEVSSHALGQHRVDAVHFASATFTNLTPEHLDFHHTMEDYFEAKARLFEEGRAAVAVVNADDGWGSRLMARLAREGRAAVGFSAAEAGHLRLGPGGSRFRWHGVDLEVSLGGRVNVANAIAAAATAEALGIGAEAMAAGLAAVKTVRGRFEPVRAGQAFTVLVDFAHTPDGLEQSLASARELASGRLLVVCGAGGERDHAKRPLMGEVASRLADLVVLTSDNPRSEDPDEIIAEISAGVRGPGALLVEPDRAVAIGAALARAGPGDVVVIAGKGHETGQEVAGVLRPFDDAAVARQALRRLPRGTGEGSDR